MARVTQALSAAAFHSAWFAAKFAAPEGQTLARAARTDDPPAVPMSGGQGPAGAAKPSHA